MNIIHATGIEGAREARGTVVVIDVLRSFTVSAYALAGGARECRLVKTVAEARALADATLGALLCAEEDALPVEGIPISNSPTMILEQDLQGRVLIQRSTAGTQAVAAVQGGDIFASSLVVATATAQACVLRNPETLTIVASADHPEDHACARYIDAVIRGEHPDLHRLLQPLRGSGRYQRAGTARRCRGGRHPSRRPTGAVPAPRRQWLSGQRREARAAPAANRSRRRPGPWPSRAPGPARDALHPMPQRPIRWF